VCRKRAHRVVGPVARVRAVAADERERSEARRTQDELSDELDRVGSAAVERDSHERRKALQRERDVVEVGRCHRALDEELLEREAGVRRCGGRDELREKVRVSASARDSRRECRRESRTHRQGLEQLVDGVARTRALDRQVDERGERLDDVADVPAGDRVNGRDDREALEARSLADEVELRATARRSSAEAPRGRHLEERRSGNVQSNRARR